MYKKFWITMMMFGFSFICISSYGYFTVTTKVTILNLDKGFQPITIHNDGGSYTHATEENEYDISVGGVPQTGSYLTAMVNYGQAYTCVYQTENRSNSAASSVQEFVITYTSVKDSIQQSLNLLIYTYKDGSSIDMPSDPTIIGEILYGFDYNRTTGFTFLYIEKNNKNQFSYVGGIFNQGGGDTWFNSNDAAYSNFLVWRN